MIDHDHLRALAENATPGPWEIDAMENGEHGLFISDDHPEAGSLGCASSQVAGFMVDRNAEFIAAANPATVLALLDDLATVTAERDAYRRGQGPAPTPATPGTVALHETHPIPNSRGDDQ